MLGARPILKILGSNEYNQPQLTNVRNLIAGATMRVRSMIKFEMLREECERTIDTPAVSNPSNFSGLRFGLCVLDDNGLQCWGTDGKSSMRPPH